MARYYNCPFCGKKHPIDQKECPNRWKYKRDNSSEENKKVNKFYSSKAWKDKREEIKTRDIYCQRCFIKFGIVTYDGLEIHHIESLTTKWEKRLQNDNLICLCKQCHSFCDKCNNGRLDFEWSPKEIEYEFEFR